jgi:hypothetical protein
LAFRRRNAWLPMRAIRWLYPPAEPQQRAEAIDFDALRAQATAALTSLQQSREARVASVATTAF